MQPDAAVAPKRRAVSLEAAAFRVARAGRLFCRTADAVVGVPAHVRRAITGPKSCCRPGSLEVGLGGRGRCRQAADPALRSLRATLSPCRDEGATSPLCASPVMADVFTCNRSLTAMPLHDGPSHRHPASPPASSRMVGPVLQDDLLSDVQELARQRLSPEERVALAAEMPESAQRQLLDDTSYALQVRASESGSASASTLIVSAAWGRAASAPVLPSHSTTKLFYCAISAEQFGVGSALPVARTA